MKLLHVNKTEQRKLQKFKFDNTIAGKALEVEVIARGKLGISRNFQSKEERFECVKKGQAVVQ